MNHNDYLKMSENLLTKLNVNFVIPGQVGDENEKYIELIFIKPEALDPNIVIDPPDFRVLVNKETLEVSLIDQM
jgi:hypothetical protein